MTEISQINPIAVLNDAHRKSVGPGWVITAGVNARGQAFVAAALAAVRAFDSFDAGEDGDDPYGEHDFGAVEVLGARLFWKIDYYDLDLSGGSPDPADPEVTRRMLTVMLADEY